MLLMLTTVLVSEYTLGAGSF